MHPCRVFIIAEAGVNHNGSVDRARQMIQAAADAGADAIKFQTFTAETLVTRKAVKAVYQKNTSGADEPQFDMLKKLELSYAAHLELMETCRSYHIEFLSSPFDLTAIDLLKNLGMTRWKIPSGEITNLPFLRKIASFNQEIFLSTGMADIEEIRAALMVFLHANIPLKKITILHCNTEYPTPMQDVNLRAMQTIKSAFPEAGIGYSDHTQGIEIPIAAVAMGATVVEKHFTLEKQLPGPDHRASLTSEEFAKMVSAIRNIEKAFGNGEKKPSPSEEKNMDVVRKSIVAAAPITKGEKFTYVNLTIKRPGNGISPMKWDDMIGRCAARNYEKDELIDA
jgi:N,N'-diacetyllegionaminate synthase